MLVLGVTVGPVPPPVAFEPKPSGLPLTAAALTVERMAAKALPSAILPVSFIL